MNGFPMKARLFRLDLMGVLSALALLAIVLVAIMLIVPGAHHAAREWVHGLPV
jgi:predicted transporter